MADQAETTTYRTCPLCEATCGLEITLAGDRITKVRGDDADVFSHGFICPKGASLGDLHADPDRLNAPLVRRDGELREATWEEAFAAVAERLGPILEAGDRNAVAAYLGNPNIHNLDGQLYPRVLLKALGTRNVFSASSVDQLPKQVAVGMMFGTGLSVPLPDIDRTDHLLMLGANPLASNGSLLTAPNMRGRLRALRERGGRLVVVDPRRTRTAELADEHVAIRPGTDAHLLLAMAHVICEEDLVDLGDVADHVEGLERVRELAARITPEQAAAMCGIEPGTIQRMARDLAAAGRACVYGRIGTTTQRFGTLASWLIDVLNVLTGNLDREGGAMFPRPAAGAANATGTPGRGKGVTTGRWTSRVRGLPESFSELPVVALTEEIMTPGEGQVRALITIAGNPALSTPDADALQQAMAGLECMISVDPYLNETSRQADVVLPPPSALYRSHYDLAFYQLAIRNVANYSPPSLPLPEGAMPEWQILLRLAAIVAGQGTDADLEGFDELVARTLIGRETAMAESPMHGADPDEVLATVAPRTGPDRLLDILLRCGPYGAGLGSGAAANGSPARLTLDLLEGEPHGIDLGPLAPRIPEMLRTASGRIELAPEPIAEDVDRLEDSLGEDPEQLVLIGRRHLRSNNSWMHNLPTLAGGPERCTLLCHPDDADRLGLADGGQARVASRVGEIEILVEVSDEIRPGVVSIPHGWGHDLPGARLTVAAERPGVNTNVLTDQQAVDPLSGNAALNGVPVTVAPA
ncbi:MAG: molybdopterin oxidoreductase family protein [Solirubrobacterales bacterium]